ncbi:MAG: MTAP family purine nucleoside phosphorylase [Nitrospinota bacterium]|nr:MTAP family purine nucleoside phosphorylase [Nitrospinota bacterium]
MSKINVAVIGGSAAYNLLKEKVFGRVTDTPSVETPYGQVDDIKLVNHAGMKFYFLSRHGLERYAVTAPFINYRANIWAFKELGVERIVSWSGPGIINPNLDVGGFAVPDDIIDMTKSRPSTFFTKAGLGFIRMSHPFCPELRHALLYSVGRMDGNAVEKATYLCTEGPRLETPAEIRLYHSYGADLVGMTLCPEAFLARELEICYAAICYLTNYAEGLVEREFRQGVLFEGMTTGDEKKKVDQALDLMPEVMAEALKVVHSQPRDCQCKNAMLRYRKQGVITEDWRKWIDP